jgi:hypothetical protein
MIIRRKTRGTDLHITNLDDLCSKLRTIGRSFKRVCKLNEDLLNETLRLEFDSPRAFVDYAKSNFSPRRVTLQFLGWTEDEILQDRKEKTELKKLGIEAAKEKHGPDHMKKNNPRCMQFWLYRGFSEAEAKLRLSEFQSKGGKASAAKFTRDKSIRCVEYWERIGHPDPVKALSDWQKLNSQRCVEYWMYRGSSLEEALNHVKTHQSNAAKAYYANSTIEERRRNNRLCEEYMIAKGMTLSEIEKAKKDNGHTFSLQTCIEKYGESEGYSVWKLRQESWQKKLKDKPKEELEAIKRRQSENTGRSVIGFSSLWNEIGVPGLFYLIQLTGAVKIGITSQETLNHRYGVANMLGLKYKCYEFDEIHDAFKLEQIVKRKYINTIKKDDYGVFGWSEVLNGETINTIAMCVDDLLAKPNVINEIFEGIKKC